ncbi:hypothetical protein A3F66_02650 [candidate division TM6 bacterium RIFCSPHIGHO2_12_FULL_32_22]|nr:MAG: hypothetical protein A3F66_02650 [candidate division TM6 bacterium RIFCSPHIGHO2_12_FULL_32_22]
MKKLLILMILIGLNIQMNAASEEEIRAIHDQINALWQDSTITPDEARTLTTGSAVQTRAMITKLLEEKRITEAQARNFRDVLLSPDTPIITKPQTAPPAQPKPASTPRSDITQKTQSITESVAFKQEKDSLRSFLDQVNDFKSGEENVAKVIENSRDTIYGIKSALNTPLEPGEKEKLEDWLKDLTELQTHLTNYSDSIKTTGLLDRFMKFINRWLKGDNETTLDSAGKGIHEISNRIIDKSGITIDKTTSGGSNDILVKDTITLKNGNKATRVRGTRTLVEDRSGAIRVTDEPIYMDRSGTYYNSGGDIIIDRPIEF